MKKIKHCLFLFVVIFPLLLSSCAKENLEDDENSTISTSFLFPFATKENHSSIQIKADLSSPVLESWFNSEIKFGRFTSVLVEGEFIYAPTEYGVAKINRQNSNIIWNKELAGLSRGNMVLDGDLLFASSDEFLYAIDKKSGEILWFKNLQHPIYSAPLVIGNNVHICDTYNGVFAFDKKTGDLKWYYEISDGCYGAAMAEKENKIFIAGGNNTIHCVDAISGKRIWEFNNNCKACSGINTTLALWEDQILFGNAGGGVYSYTTSGDLGWQYKHPTRIYFKGVAVAEGKVIATGKTDFDKIITICLDIKTNKLLWEYDHGLTKFSSHATIVNNKHVLVGTGFGLDNIDLKTGKLVWTKITKGGQGSTISSSCNSNFAITDNELIYTTNNGGLIRFIY